MPQRLIPAVLLLVVAGIGTAVVAEAMGPILRTSVQPRPTATLPVGERSTVESPGVVPSVTGRSPSEPPSPVSLRLTGPITDPTGVIGDPSAARAAIDRLRCRTGTALYAELVATTAGVEIEAFETQVAAVNVDLLTPMDALLIVATKDRHFALTTGEHLNASVSQAELDTVSQRWVRPRLQRDDWAGAIEAAAAGLEVAILGDVQAGPPGSPAVLVKPPVAGTCRTASEPPPSDLPFTFDAPAGWSWSPMDGAGVLGLGPDDPLLRWLQAEGWDPTVPTARWQDTRDGGGTVAITWVHLQGACAPATALETIERQNAISIGAYPGLVEGPTVGRVRLPDGEAVRITWTGRVPADGPLIEAVGYALIVGDVLYTIVVSQPTEVPATMEADLIAAGFRARPGWPLDPIPSGSPVSTAPPDLEAGEVVIPHQAPELEALLPCALGGRMLSRWSLRGIDFLEMGGRRLSPVEVAQLTVDLRSAGLSIDDVAYAVDGRSDTVGDPPWFVTALRFGDMPAEQLPPETGIDHPGAGTLETIVLSGARVRRGTASMVEQSEHVRGRPYILDVGTVRFVVVTEDETWAAEAIADLMGSTGR